MSRYVFYLGGPRARPISDGGYWVTARLHNPGCVVAGSVGVKLDRQTYYKADPAYSQYSHNVWIGRSLRAFGTNVTALLPLEV